MRMEHVYRHVHGRALATRRTPSESSRRGGTDASTPRAADHVVGDADDRELEVLVLVLFSLANHSRFGGGETPVTAVPVTIPLCSPSQPSVVDSGHSIEIG